MTAVGFPKSLVDQSGASAGENIVSGNLTVNHYYAKQAKKSPIDELIDRLHIEIESKIEIQHTIKALQRYEKKHSVDGVVGLEAKLDAADRSHEIFYALEMKEEFSKLLEYWSLYASAQEIFAILLARVEHHFNYSVFPAINKLDELEVNSLVTEKVVEPAVELCGATVLSVNHATAMGMVYWLAEQCFLRWHR